MLNNHLNVRKAAVCMHAEQSTSYYNYLFQFDRLSLEMPSKFPNFKSVLQTVQTPLVLGDTGHSDPAVEYLLKMEKTLKLISSIPEGFTNCCRYTAGVSHELPVKICSTP